MQVPLLRIPAPGSAEGGRTPRGGPSGIPKPTPQHQQQHGGRGGASSSGGWQGGDPRERGATPVTPLSAAAAFLQTPRSAPRPRPRVAARHVCTGAVTRLFSTSRTAPTMQVFGALSRPLPPGRMASCGPQHLRPCVVFLMLCAFESTAS